MIKIERPVGRSIVYTGVPLNRDGSVMQSLCIAVHASKQEIDAEVCYEYCKECQYAVCVEYYGVAHGFY